MSNRIGWPDYAKAIGIILVVYGHVARGLFSAGIEIPENIYKLVDSIVYSFHMPLFFFLSGLFFYDSFSKRGGFGLILNKIDTIVYPYLVWSILQGTVEVLLSNYTNGSVSFTDVFALWDPRAQFWFLYALFVVFVVSCGIFYSVSKKYTILILMLASILYVNGSALPNLKLLSFISNNLVYFVLGIAFTQYDFGKHISSKVSLLIAILAFILSQYIFHNYLGRLYTDKGIGSLILGCISIAFIVALSMVMAKTRSRFFAYIGASSMAIYLMHILAGSGARVILSKILAVDSVVIHIVVGCLAGVLLPLLALKFINALKIPYIFSAPISQWLKFSYNKALQRTSR